jgi:exodeoxyribonuclease V gamma subunit
VLVAMFIERLTRERASAGPFAPERLVVPNRHVESYLRLRIAEQCGIAANIESSFLRKTLAGIVESSLPGVRVADAAHVEGHLLALLHDEDFLAQPALAPVRAYLDAGGLDRDATDRRRCQLASVLSHLFDEYAVSRLPMIEAWAGQVPDAAKNDGDPPAQLWQRNLWRAVFAGDGRLQKQFLATQIRTDRLSVLWDEAMAQTSPPFAGKTLHVFGLSYMAVGYHRMLATLGKASDVYVYSLNPCREEDLQPKATAASLADPFGLSDEPHPLLRRWGRPGRESLRLLTAFPNVTVEADFPDDKNDKASSLLHRLQSDVVNNRLPAQTSGLDDSLRVLPCPSLRRELEVVAAEIWKLARKDPSLRLCDVAVVVPEASKDLYLAQLPAVFRESCNLPHTIADVPAATTHRVAEVIALLLRMPLSSFTRKELLPLITHPCLMARFPKATAEAWRELAHALGIVRGALRSDLDGTYVARDVFTWDQGLRRLALGVLVDAAPGKMPEPIKIGDEVILPGPGIASDDDEILGFGLLARSLLADARFAVSGGKTPARLLGEWLDFMRAMLGAYIVLDDGDTVGKAVLSQFLSALDNVSDLGLGACAISYRVAAELALRALESLPSHRGQYLAHGVTVASFVPMRAIPFRAVFVVGLGQSGFPRTTGGHELDLRAGERQAGDVDGREQDLYMFLETLLSARDHVTLSYVARDEITGDELPGSSVLLELRALLGQGMLAAGDVQRLFCEDRPALRRYDDRDDRRALLPAAEAEHRAKELGDSRDTRGPLATVVPRSDNTIASSPQANNDKSSPLQIPLWALRRFLDDPLQGSARFRLGMRDDDGVSLADVEDEPFDLDKGTQTELVRATMTDILGAPDLPDLPELGTVLAAYVRHAERVELSGQSPTGLFRTSGLALEKSLLAGWHALLPTILGSGPTACRKIRFISDSRTPETRTNIVYQPMPVFTINVPGAGSNRGDDVRIGGTTGLCGGGTLLGFTCRSGITAGGICREDLGAFLDYVAMTAAGIVPAPTGLRSAVFFVKEGRACVRVLEFAPLECGQARAYLAALCTDLLTGSLDDTGSATGIHPYLLPHEAVLASRQRRTTVSDEIADLCAKAEGERGRFSSLFGPVPAVLARYAALPEDQAQAMVERRFGLLFELAQNSRHSEDST